MSNITRAISGVFTILLVIVLFAGLGTFTVGYASNVLAVSQQVGFDTNVLRFAFYATYDQFGVGAQEFLREGPIVLVLAASLLLVYTLPQAKLAAESLSGRRAS